MTDEAGVRARRGLRAAMEARDHAAVVELLAPDIVVKSPIIGMSRFRGREAVSDLYAAIIEGFADYRYVAELEGDGQQLLMFEGTLRGRRMEGVDMLRVDDQGRIVEMTVMFRPLSGLIGFLVVIGPLIAKRRGRGRELAMRLISAPLPLVATLVERLGPRLINTGGR
jgi:hypothetical protein